MLIMNREYNDQSEDKNESELSGAGLSQKAEQLIEELENMHGDARQKILDLIDTLRHDGLKDRQIGKILVERVKFVSRTTLYEYMPQELKRQYTKPLTNTINISTNTAESFKVPRNVPVTTPETIITKSEGEIAEAEYKKETQPEGFPFSNENRDRQLTLDEVFKFLPNDNGMTSWKAESVSGKALKNRITSWQGNSDKFFRVWLQEITK